MPYRIVALDRARAQNERRLAGWERMGRRKPLDGTLLRPDRYERVLIMRGTDRVLHSDVTELTAAETIAKWET